MKRALLVAVGLSFLLAGSTFVFRDQAAAQSAGDIVGTWALVSITNEKDGQKVLPYGPDAKGSFTLDGRRFSLIVVRPGRPHFKSDNRLTGTAEENRDTVQGSIAYFGTYSVDEQDKTLVTFHIEGSTFPNWDGAEQKRVLKVAGEEMEYTNPTISTGAGVARLVWRRANPS
ncbi:MAG TPA: lipocalin-like domain-containing protein [Stellaceae bacterium]|nr:lipocalin-like domain-containing protein [Stellaceae bacterium]